MKGFDQHKPSHMNTRAERSWPGTARLDDRIWMMEPDIALVVVY